MELPPPPRSPAQFRFPGAVGIVFDFPRLCRRRRRDSAVSAVGNRPVTPKNAAPVSGLAKPFPGGIPTREQRPVRMSAETGSSPKCLGFFERVGL
jgi:hypothetical protein